MVRDTLDNLLSNETGNATLCRVDGDSPGLYLEALYVAEPTIARDLRADRFLPPTPIRVVVDATGEADLGADDLRSRAQPADVAILTLPQLEALLPQLLETARTAAAERGPAIAAAARQRMRQHLEPAVERLAELARVNPSVSAAELEAAQAQLRALDEGLQSVRVRLDALRLILAGSLC
jgi:ATP-dependent helicase HepA